MCSTMSGEHEKKRKRKKEKVTDERHAEIGEENLPEASAKPVKKSKQRRSEPHPSSHALAEAEKLPKDEGGEEMKKKKKKKSKLETVKHRQPSGAAELRSDQPEATPNRQVNKTVPVNNKEEAEGIRARLGISAADPKSAQKRMTFQFGFNVPEPTHTAEPEAAEDPAATNAASKGVKAVQRPESGHAQPMPESEQPEQALPPPPLRNHEQVKSVPESTTQAAREASGNESQDLVPRRVYVGGMPFWYTEEQIRECWGECGEIENLTMMTFPDSGNFRGLAFITFATEEAYEAALAFNGDELEGKYLVVKPCKAAGSKAVRPANKENASQPGSGGVGGKANVARDRAPKSGREAGGKKVGKKFDEAPARVKDYNVLFVGNVPWELTRNSVSELFREFKPKFVRMFDKPGTKQHKGFAHVHFLDEASVDKALSMNGASIMGRKLVVMYAQPSKEVKRRPSQDLIEDGM